jgi:hypothetical protein
MFCGKDESFGRMTVEHFVPKCLWDGKRPSFTRTVPAHMKCNNKYAADNEYFRDVLAFDDAASNHPEVIKLTDGTLDRKMRKRHGAVLKVLKNMRIRPRLTPAGLYVGHAPVFDCDWERMRIVLRNIMRGMFYTVKNYPLPQDMELKLTHIPDDTALLPAKSIVDQMSPCRGFGDDVFACRYVFHENDDYMVCLMHFYAARMFFGSAMIPADRRAKEQPAPA